MATPNEQQRFASATQKNVNLGGFKISESNQSVSSSQKRESQSVNFGKRVAENGISPQPVSAPQPTPKYFGSNLGAQVDNDQVPQNISQNSEAQTGAGGGLSASDASSERLGVRDQKEASHALRKQKKKKQQGAIKKAAKGKAKTQVKKVVSKKIKRFVQRQILATIGGVLVSNAWWIVPAGLVVMVLMYFGYKYPLTAKFTITAATISTRFTLYAFEKFVTTFVL